MHCGISFRGFSEPNTLNIKSKTVQTAHSVSKLGPGEVKGSRERFFKAAAGIKIQMSLHLKCFSVTCCLVLFSIKSRAWMIYESLCFTDEQSAESALLEVQTSSHGSSGGSGWRWILVCQGSVPNGSGATDSAATVL